MTTSDGTIGVLLMAYGSPERLDQVAAYLMDIRGGRPPSAESVAEMRGRYARIGGHSPLLARTRQQAQALEAELNRRPEGRVERFKTFVGMRHWDPRIRAAVAEMTSAGIRRGIALVMAPHASRLSTGRYFALLDAVISDQAPDLEMARVESWHDHPGLIASLAEQVTRRLDAFLRVDPFVIFTAHSLPSSILAAGDPYDTQLRRTAALVADRLHLSPDGWTFCYQSAAASVGPWLGPALEEVVVDLTSRGVGDLLVAPIGFVCDHIEVLYDIDIACRELAAQHGARLERSPSLNAEPTFIGALADLVLSQIAIPDGEK